MQEKKYITLHCKRKDYDVEINKILYVLMLRSYAEVHVYGGDVYVTRRTYKDIAETLGDNFIEVRRGCLVAVMAIYNVGKTEIELINGETVKFTSRKKNEVMDKVSDGKQRIISTFTNKALKTEAEYRKHYESFGNISIAFADIEIVYDKKHQTVDWIFRYGNEALAKLEKLPLEQLVGHSFSSLFSDMDSKWIRSYERSAIYGETLETVYSSPRIGIDLKIISFPTFEGHCGCFLFNVDDIGFEGSDKAKLSYISTLASSKN